MAKNKLKCIFLYCCIFLFVGGCGKPQPSDKAESAESDMITVENIAPDHILNSDALYWSYTYEELKEKADAIVKVKVLDDLTLENSLADYESENGWVTNFCSARSVQALEFYKNETGISMGDTFLVQQEAAIYMSNGEYFMNSLNGETPLLRDNTYILYLQKADTSMSGELVIMSGENGLIHLENLTEDQQFIDITVKTLAEFECGMDEELKNKLLEAETISLAPEDIKENTVELEIGLAEQECDVTLGYEKTKEGVIAVSIEQE